MADRGSKLGHAQLDSEELSQTSLLENLTSGVGGV